MRVIDAVLGHFKRTRRDDPLFGVMSYMGDRLKYWEGKAMFTPTASVVEVFVDGSADDDMERQREFFQRSLREWPSLSEAIGRMLLKGWHEREPKIPVESPWDQFRVSSLSIPKASIEDAEWQISFVTPSDPNHLWTLDMRGRQPLRLIVEG
jgi:hypothetical protein